MATVTTTVILEPKRNSVTASTFSSSICHEMMEPVFIAVPKKGNAKECSNYRKVALISHTSKVMLKILQTRLQLYVENFQIFKLDLEKVGTIDQIATSVRS